MVSTKNLILRNKFPAMLLCHQLNRQLLEGTYSLKREDKIGKVLKGSNRLNWLEIDMNK